jgi:hypothetical protein
MNGGRGRNFFSLESLCHLSLSLSVLEINKWCHSSASTLYLGQTESERPNWANFRPMDDCLLCAGILKITEVAQIFGYFFARLRLRQKCIGLHFGRFFHLLIWSPWTESKQISNENNSHSYLCTAIVHLHTSYIHIYIYIDFTYMLYRPSNR